MTQYLDQVTSTNPSGFLKSIDRPTLRVHAVEPTFRTIGMTIYDWTPSTWTSSAGDQTVTEVLMHTRKGTMIVASYQEALQYATGLGGGGASITSQWDIGDSGDSAHAATTNRFGGSTCAAGGRTLGGPDSFFNNSGKASLWPFIFSADDTSVNIRYFQVTTGTDRWGTDTGPRLLITILYVDTAMGMNQPTPGMGRGSLAEQYSNVRRAIQLSQ